MAQLEFQQIVERWDVFEVSLTGPSHGNPFVDQHLSGTFQGPDECKTAAGFYDGDGIYRVRFMPSQEGEYHFSLNAGFLTEPAAGSFRVTPAARGNHGPVRVANTFHFAYEDGTPYYSVGTTCYVWTHQSPERQEQTLRTLRRGYFNKLRFCIFPKHYDFNFADPVTFPYEGTPCDNSALTRENFTEYLPSSPENHWDFSRFHPLHFRLLENRIRDLRDMGIEADLILFHPYDRWGFSRMGREADDLYLNYLVARFSAYRNVWWSLANEYDIMGEKTLADWEHYADLICRSDPYGHLRSIHNCFHFYDYSRPWVTHCSIQRQDQYKCAELTDSFRARYRKPVVLDEIAYEGNLPHCWGNLGPRELVRRFWEAAVRGGYAGHGETYLDYGDCLWWSHGGELHGESPERIRFLHQILAETPGLGLKKVDLAWDDCVGTAESGEPYYLYYYGFFRPAFREFYFDDEFDYSVEVIDTWEMTVEPRGTFRGKFRVELPSKEYMALRIRRSC